MYSLTIRRMKYFLEKNKLSEFLEMQSKNKNILCTNSFLAHCTLKKHHYGKMSKSNLVRPCLERE